MTNEVIHATNSLAPVLDFPIYVCFRSMYYSINVIDACFVADFESLPNPCQIIYCCLTYMLKTNLTIDFFFVCIYM